MANMLSSIGETRLAWSLSDSAGVSRSSEQQIVRALSNGTGPSQGQVAYATTMTITGPVSVFADEVQFQILGADAAATFSRVREVLVDVTTGPTGGWVLFGASTGPSGATGVEGVAVRVGGQLHLVDHGVGVEVGSGGASAAWAFSPGPTGTYTIDFHALGNGIISTIC